MGRIIVNSLKFDIKQVDESQMSTVNRWWSWSFERSSADWIVLFGAKF